MAARGRGRGGRGRGGAVQSYFKDELQIAPTEFGVIQPPPLYPPLESQPTPLPLEAEYHNRLKGSTGASSSFQKFTCFREELADTWKKQLRHLFQDEKREDVECYYDRYTEPSLIPQRRFDIDYNRIPKELRPSRKRQREAKSGPKVPKKQQKLEDKSVMMKTLEELEQKEVEVEKETDVADDEKNKAGDNEDEDEEEVEEGNESDYEDGNDYVDNYFDNGEGFGDDSDGSGAEAFY